MFLLEGVRGYFHQTTGSNNFSGWWYNFFRQSNNFSGWWDNSQPTPNQLPTNRIAGLCSKMSLLDFGRFWKINQASSFSQVKKARKMAACDGFVSLSETKMKVKIWQGCTQKRLVLDRLDGFCKGNYSKKTYFWKVDFEKTALSSECETEIASTEFV